MKKINIVKESTIQSYIIAFLLIGLTINFVFAFIGLVSSIIIISLCSSYEEFVTEFDNKRKKKYLKNN